MLYEEYSYSYGTEQQSGSLDLIPVFFCGPDERQNILYICIISYGMHLR